MIRKWKINRTRWDNMNHPNCCPKHPQKVDVPTAALYTRLMHPEVQQNHPGDCPIKVANI